ncbi:hypothetical protein PAXRUDRAFT_158052 [Paxillus rubicundulus Ve08.2h10]|uniref:Uncharacterized protein n=1 Tax=Paxillus rubicundulus Ve08.2h10 TaxID=930991 RepID=A0A0D0D9Y5_9AGAM|nr:hypothetical protein PAXRUDRAFT_158052 [Paxillus rubicundulus Ve08.2h10]
MKTALIIPTLLKLTKQFDDFVAPAAVRVLCSLLQEPIAGDQEKNEEDRSTADLRETMLQSGVLSTFLDMLNHCSADTKQVASDALVEFAKQDEIRQALVDDGHLRALAKRAHSHMIHKRDGAIMSLVALSEKVRAAVKNAIIEAGTIKILVARLSLKSNALFAASALAGLVKIDDVATMVAAEGSNVPAHISNMLRRRRFDGSHGEDGINVLYHLLECGRLRSTVLKSEAVNVLRGMLEHGNDDTVYAALHYLRAIARFEDGKRALRDDDGLVPPLLRALRVPRQKVQRIAIEILRGHFEEGENLREKMLDGLLGLLMSRTASDVFVSSTMLRLLAPYKCVRDEVLSNDAFWNLSNEYYNVLNLTYDKKGPRFEEVYESVGFMITSVQEGEGSRRSNDKWLEPVPYEL